MKYITIREEYTRKDGSVQVNWNRIGCIFEANGKEYVKLYTMPNIVMHVYEPPEKDDKPKKEKPITRTHPEEQYDEEF